MANAKINVLLHSFCFFLNLRAFSEYMSPGACIWWGDLSEGIFRYEYRRGLIHGGAYFLNLRYCYCPFDFVFDPISCDKVWIKVEGHFIMSILRWREVSCSGHAGKNVQQLSVEIYSLFVPWHIT